MAVRIDIGDDGQTRVSVSGIVLELVETVVVTYQKDHPPRVSVGFVDTKKIFDPSVRLRMRAVITSMENLARMSRCIEVISTGDTMPSGLQAIRPPPPEDER